MPHRFDSRKLGHLDSPFRKLLMPPKRSLKRLGLKEGDVLLDIGAGSGFFSLPGSELVGDAGRVYAVDIAPEAIALIERKAAEAGRKNLSTILSTETVLGPPTGVGSLALMSTVLHEIDNKEGILRAIHRALRRGGRIAILEFSIAAFFGPPRSILIGKPEMLGLLARAGFSKPELRRWNSFLYLATAVA